MQTFIFNVLRNCLFLALIVFAKISNPFAYAQLDVDKKNPIEIQSVDQDCGCYKKIVFDFGAGGTWSGNSQNKPYGFMADYEIKIPKRSCTIISNANLVSLGRATVFKAHEIVEFEGRHLSFNF